MSVKKQDNYLKYCILQKSYQCNFADSQHRLWPSSLSNWSIMPVGLWIPLFYRSDQFLQSYRPGNLPGRVAQSVGHLTRKSGVLGSIPGLATYFRFSFRFFKKGSCQLLAKVCA